MTADAMACSQTTHWRVPRLYGLADLGVIGATRLPEAVAQMALGGLAWIQLRMKQASGALAERLVRACLARVAGSGVALWIDDRVDLAAMLPVAGVHLGQRDLSPGAARRVLDGVVGRSSCRIGLSTHNEAQLRAAAADPAVDVIAIGPVFETIGKQDPEPSVGLAGVRRARALTRGPLVAIGGIGADRLPAVLAAGADSVALLGACCRGDVAANVARLRAALEAPS